MARELPIWGGVLREGVRVLEPWDLWKNGLPGVMLGASEGEWRPPGQPKRVTASSTCAVLPQTRGYTKGFVFMGKEQYDWGAPA